MAYRSISAAAQATGISGRTIRRWLAEGRIAAKLDTAERAGAGRRGYCINEAELAELIDRLDAVKKAAKAPPRYADGYRVGLEDGRLDRDLDRPRLPFSEPMASSDQWGRGYAAGYRAGYAPAGF